MAFNLNTTNSDELRAIALYFERKRDYNNSIKYLFKAAKAGSALACIDLCYNIMYIVGDYEYDAYALSLIAPIMFEVYLDLGIKYGSLDCLFFKARAQYFGEYIKPDFKDALASFKHLKEVGYDPYEYFSDEWTLDDYIESTEEFILKGRPVYGNSYDLATLKTMVDVFKATYGANS